MTQIIARHRAFAVRAVVLVMLVLAAILALPFAAPNLAQESPPPSADLDGDETKDTLEPEPDPPGAAPGEVEVRSGDYGQLIVRL